MATSDVVHSIATALGNVMAELENYPDDAEESRYHYLLGKKTAYVSIFKELTK